MYSEHAFVTNVVVLKKHIQMCANTWINNTRIKINIIKHKSLQTISIS